MTTAHIQPASFNVFNHFDLPRRMRAALAAMAHARQRRRAAAELYAMSAHELKDLGIGRSEVMHCATRP